MATYKSRKGGAMEYTQYPDKLEKLKTVFAGMASKHDRDLSKVTINNYTNKLNKLSIIATGHGYDGTHEWFVKDPESVIEKLRKGDYSGKKDFLSPVVKMLKHLNAHNDVIEKYQKAMASFKDDEYKVRKTNKATPEQVEHALPLEDILKRIKDFKVTDDTSLIYKLICSMYFQNSLVPRNDLPLMKFVSTNKKASAMSPDFNYITLDKNGTPIDIIMKAYKSRNTYGTQKYVISAPVRELMKEYVRRFGKKPGDFLFVMRDGEPFKKPNFVDMIGNATEAVLRKRMTADIMRQIQITHYYNQHAHSIEDIENDSHRYLHSSAIHSEYLRTNLPQDDD